MRFMMMVLLVLLTGCSASTPALIESPSVVVSEAVMPHATDTLGAATPTSSATSTSVPTATGTPTVTAAATSTPTLVSSPTPTIEPVDVSAWQTPLVTAGLTVAVINALEEMAMQLQSGTLESIEAGGRLLGYQIALGTVAQALDETTLEAGPARFKDNLRANLAGVYAVTDRWQRGEITSATVAEELGSVRAASEQTLAEMLDELRSLGVRKEQIDEFLEAVNAALEQ